MVGVYMKLPRFLLVFGDKIKLRIKDLPYGVAAQYDIDKKIITLSPIHETDDGLLHSLLHEAGHSLFYRVSINQAVSFETHEFIVNNYATMLLENFDIKPKLKK